MNRTSYILASKSVIKKFPVICDGFYTIYRVFSILCFVQGDAMSITDWKGFNKIRMYLIQKDKISVAYLKQDIQMYVMSIYRWYDWYNDTILAMIVSKFINWLLHTFSI